MLHSKTTSFSVFIMHNVYDGLFGLVSYLFDLTFLTVAANYNKLMTHHTVFSIY